MKKVSRAEPTKSEEIRLTLRRQPLNLNEVDEEIRDLVRLLNKVPVIETTSSCTGHPNTPTTEWWEGAIRIAPTDEVGLCWDLLDNICSLLDNTRGSKRSQTAKDDPYFNRTRKLYRQVGGESLYASAIPVLRVEPHSIIAPSAPVENLPSAWNVILSSTQKYISSREALPLIETPRAGAEAFVNLLQSVPRIQEITARPGRNNRFDPTGLYPDAWWVVKILYPWNRSSVLWGWDFMKHLRTQFDREVGSLAPLSGFTLIPNVRRGDLQRTREDHLRIWKLIELAVREILRSETAT